MRISLGEIAKEKICYVSSTQTHFHFFFFLISRSLSLEFTQARNWVRRWDEWWRGTIDNLLCVLDEWVQSLATISAIELFSLALWRWQRNQKLIFTRHMKSNQSSIWLMKFAYSLSSGKMQSQTCDDIQFRFVVPESWKRENFCLSSSRRVTWNFLCFQLVKRLRASCGWSEGRENLSFPPPPTTSDKFFRCCSRWWHSDNTHNSRKKKSSLTTSHLSRYVRRALICSVVFLISVINSPRESGCYFKIVFLYVCRIFAGCRPDPIISADASHVTHCCAIRSARRVEDG